MKKGLVGLFSAGMGAAIGATVLGIHAKDEVTKATKMSDKHLALFLMMNQWVKVKQEGKNLATYFEDKGYKKIAIYGMSYAGETLVAELKNTEIDIAYAIDKNADAIYADIDVVTIEEPLEAVDVVVVTPITFFEEIEGILSEKLECPIVSLDDILFEV